MDDDGVWFYDCLTDDPPWTGRAAVAIGAAAALAGAATAAGALAGGLWLVHKANPLRPWWAP